jgi:2-polyprenyl-6-methoxyphenol hydroxylase-like FAD-dependent oxidoreductase
VKAAKPLSPIIAYRATENRGRHDENLAQWPDDLVVLGDAACTFNPVHGQGMTVAALAALALQQCLRDQRSHAPKGDLTGLGQRFQEALARINRGRGCWRRDRTGATPLRKAHERGSA